VQGSIASIATWYRLDGPGIKYWWGWGIPRLSKLAPGPTQPPVQWVLDLFLRVKWQGYGVGHPSPSSAKIKEIVELYTYPLSGPSWPVLEWSLPLSWTLLGKQCAKEVTCMWELSTCDNKKYSNSWILNKFCITCICRHSFMLMSATSDTNMMIIRTCEVGPTLLSFENPGVLC